MAERGLMDGAGTASVLRAFVPLAEELGDLKRVRDASSPDSLAVRAFRHAWGRIAAGDDARDVALLVTADALAALRLGGIDRAVLADLAVPEPNVILRRSFDEVSGPVAWPLRNILADRLGQVAPSSPAPAFAEALINQPRAGATCPGRKRLVLEPPENHGDHCLVVAVLGVVLSPRYDADSLQVFLAGLAHHLHNAFLPDSGFAGEMLLGDALPPLMSRLFARALDTLPAPIAATVHHALGCIGDAETPEGRAFHAADVLDRVLQMRHYEQVAQFRMADALDDMNLVHAGPVQAFHHAVLAEAGLW